MQLSSKYPKRRRSGWPTLTGPVLALTIALTLALAIAACGPGATPVPAPAEPDTPVSQAQQTTPQEPAAEPTLPPAATTAPATIAPATTAPATTPAKTEPAGVTTQPTDAPPTEPSEPPEPPAAAAATSTAAPQPAPTPEKAEAPEATEPAMPQLTTPQLPEPGQVENVVFVVGEGSEATFTVNEKLNWLDLPNDAVMRTSTLSGKVYLDGQNSVVDIDLHSMTSDNDRRDNYVRRRMFPDHRVATFTVANLGELPNPFTVGEVITREVPGQLTIAGITKPITFEVEARLDPEQLFILGRATFTWEELEIPPPNIPGRIQVKDEVRVEVLLSATPTLAGGQ